MPLRISRRAVSASSLILLTLFSINAVGQRSTSQTRHGDEQDIFEAVIRAQMKDWYRKDENVEAETMSKADRGVSKRLKFPIFFVSINGKDPGDEFINRFRDVPRTIRKASSAKVVKPHTPTDRTTGMTGIVFDAANIDWLSDDTVEVEGGYYCGGLCAADSTFQVHRENDKWIVKSSDLNGIS